jgi:hypothetical protein
MGNTKKEPAIFREKKMIVDEIHKIYVSCRKGEGAERLAEIYRKRF